MAWERGRVSERRAHALGFVSRMIVRSEGGGADMEDLSMKQFNDRWENSQTVRGLAVMV